MVFGVLSPGSAVVVILDYSGNFRKDHNNREITVIIFSRATVSWCQLSRNFDFNSIKTQHIKCYLKTANFYRHVVLSVSIRCSLK